MPPKTLPRAVGRSWAPSVAPFVLFLVLTSIEGQFPAHYPLLYTVKIVLTCALLAILRSPAPATRSWRCGLGLAALAGVALGFTWVPIDQHTPHPASLASLLGHRVAYNPFHEIADPAARAAFLAVRFFGLVVVVPIIEETFYRGFLLRYVTDLDDWRRVPVGTFSATALVANVVLFTLSHPEWLAAAVFATAMCGLMARTKNLTACILAHAVTNLLLGLYVIQAGMWQYW